MQTRPAFTWYIIHKETRFVVAGFVEYDEALRFLVLTQTGHTQYTVVPSSEIL